MHAFKLERIRNAELTDETFEIPEALERLRNAMGSDRQRTHSVPWLLAFSSVCGRILASRMRPV